MFWELAVCHMLINGECILTEDISKEIPLPTKYTSMNECSKSTANDAGLEWLTKRSEDSRKDLWFVCRPNRSSDL